MNSKRYSSLAAFSIGLICAVVSIITAQATPGKGGVTSNGPVTNARPCLLTALASPIEEIRHETQLKSICPLTDDQAGCVFDGLQDGYNITYIVDACKV